MFFFFLVKIFELLICIVFLDICERFVFEFFVCICILVFGCFFINFFVAVSINGCMVDELEMVKEFDVFLFLFVDWLFVLLFFFVFLYAAVMIIIAVIRSVSIYLFFFIF